MVGMYEISKTIRVKRLGKLERKVTEGITETIKVK